MRALSATRGLQHQRALRGPKHMLGPVAPQPAATTVRITPKAAAAEPRTAVESVASEATSGFDSVEDGIAAIARGEFVLVMDDQDRENEGDLIIAAEMATQPKIAYMVEYTSGTTTSRFCLHWHWLYWTCMRPSAANYLKLLLLQPRAAVSGVLLPRSPHGSE